MAEHRIKPSLLSLSRKRGPGFLSALVCVLFFDCSQLLRRGRLMRRATQAYARDNNSFGRCRFGRRLVALRGWSDARIIGAWNRDHGEEFAGGGIHRYARDLTGGIDIVGSVDRQIARLDKSIEVGHHAVLPEESAARAECVVHA